MRHMVAVLLAIGFVLLSAIGTAGQQVPPADTGLAQPRAQSAVQPPDPAPTNDYGPSSGYRPLEIPKPAQQPAQSVTPAQSPTSVNPFAAAQGMVNSTIPTFQANSPAAPAALAEKPFSGYSPTPALSPYMNLYRRDNNFGTVNNYYSLVRPMLEQRAYNQRLQYEIGSLERATRSQSQAIQQLDQRTNYLYGIPSGGSFMNFQGYYPGLQSSGR